MSVCWAGVMRRLLLITAVCNVNLQKMKRKSTDISSYFKKKMSKGETELAGEQQHRASEEMAIHARKYMWNSVL